jgi:hypothetical protein
MTTTTTTDDTDDVIRPSSYAIADSYATHVAHPDTFAIPDPDKIRAIAPGDNVKVIYDLTWPDDPRLSEPGQIPPPGGERIWVKVTEVRKGCQYAGTLANQPMFTGQDYGDVVEFSAAHVIDIEPAAGDAMTVTSRDQDSESFDISELLAHPDVVVTEEDAIAEGAVVSMGGYGIAEFRGEPVRTVSQALFEALQNAFRLAATAGARRLSDKEVAAEIDAMDGEHGRDPGYVAWVRSLQPATRRSIMGIVPFWANLGELLAAFIGSDHGKPLGATMPTARDGAGPGEPPDCLYVTPPVKALRDQEIWLQRPRPGEWTAFFPADY